MAGTEPLVHFEELAAQFEGRLRLFIDEHSTEGVPNLHDALGRALGTDLDDPNLRGKRIRPVLCLLTAEALGADVERAYPFAVAIELLHNFCLVHDDIEDGDVMRRGRASIWVEYGLPHAINIGDYHYVLAQRAVAEWGTADLDDATRFGLLKLIGRVMDRTHIGQAMDMNARATRKIDVDDYLALVREKTGYYLAAPIQGGAIVAGADDALIQSIEDLALVLGPLFQIVDDIIDLTEGKGRGAVGSDVGEGKRSYMVAWAAENGGDEREMMFEILDKPREETTSEDVAQVGNYFERIGAIEAGRKYCEELFEESKKRLGAMPRPLADALGPVFESLVHRSR